MILTIASKELKALFASPLAWVVLTITQLFLALVFLQRHDDFIQIQPQLIQLPNPPGITEFLVAPLYGMTVFILLFAVPLLSMRLIAEERRNQTIVLLISAPLSMTEIVLGKFCGLAAFLLILVGITTLMPLALLFGGRLDFGLLAGLIMGIALLALACAAVGLYASGLTAHPLVAAMIAFGLLFGMLLIGGVAPDALQARGWPVPAALAQVLSPFKNYEPFAKGVIDSDSVACTLLLIATLLILTVRRLDAARLRS